MNAQGLKFNEQSTNHQNLLTRTNENKITPYDSSAIKNKNEQKTER
jgi:hypothetical protein